MKNVNEELIDYEELFKDVHKHKKPSPNIDSKAILSIVLYFFIMMGGGLLFLAHFISEKFVPPHNDESSIQYVTSYVSNNENGIGLINFSEYEILIEDNDTYFQDSSLLSIGDIEFNDIHYQLIININKNEHQLWLKDDSKANESILNEIFKGNITTWNDTDDEIAFYLTIGSPIYKYITETLNADVDISTLKVIKNYSTDYGNILNFITYLFVTIPIFFIFRVDLKYDLVRLNHKDKKKSLFEEVITGFAFMLLVSLALGVLTMLLQKIMGIESNSVNQATIEVALKSQTAVLMVISAVIFAPIVEELIFRKAIFTLIKKPYIAIIVSSLAFGLIHVAGEPNIIHLLVQIIPYLGMGAFLGYYYYYKADGNIVTLILMHAASNFISVIPILFS